MIITTPAANIHVVPAWSRTTADVARLLGSFPTALVDDAQSRLGAMRGAIRQLTPGLAMAGTALPVLAREGDNLAIHRALDEAQAGDVLVVDAQSYCGRAVFGDVLGRAFLDRGVQGIVVDGAVRDVEELSLMGMPTFARSVSPAGPYKDGPGVVGDVIACGGQVCRPGDVVLGDADGVVVVRADRAQAVLAATERQAEVERVLRSRIEQLMHGATKSDDS